MRKLVSAVVLLVAVSLAGLTASCSSEGGGAAAPSCSELCPDVLAAGCGAGPVDEADCEAGCAVIEQSCGAEYDDYAACGGATPTISCNGNDFPIVAGCEAENDALLACLVGAAG